MAKMGRPRTDAKPVMVRLPPDLLAQVDKLIALAQDDPSRPEMIRRILADYMDVIERQNVR